MEQHDDGAIDRAGFAIENVDAVYLHGAIMGRCRRLLRDRSYFGEGYRG